jgi:hypothetical protein
LEAAITSMEKLEDFPSKPKQNHFPNDSPTPILLCPEVY